MIDFHQTQRAQILFEAQIPRALDALNRIAAAQERIADSHEKLAAAWGKSPAKKCVDNASLPDRKMNAAEENRPSCCLLEYGSSFSADPWEPVAVFDTREHAEAFVERELQKNDVVSSMFHYTMLPFREDE